LPLSWFFFPPEVDAAGRLPLVAPPGVAAGREPLTGLLVELLFGNPEAQALLSKRLHDLLKDHPLEMEGPFMRYLDEATGQASRRAIEHAVGELDGWVKKLRELAVYLEEARDSTLPTMESGLQRFINDRYGQLLAEDETEPQPGPGAGSR